MVMWWKCGPFYFKQMLVLQTRANKAIVLVERGFIHISLFFSCLLLLMMPSGLKLWKYF